MNDTSISKTTKTTTASIAEPVLHQTAKVIQKYGTRFPVPLGLEDKVCEQSISDLNGVLADTITLRDLYKKCHWQTSGATFYQLHLLFDKHYNEQAALVDLIAERIQLLAGLVFQWPEMLPNYLKLSLHQQDEKKWRHKFHVSHQLMK